MEHQATQPAVLSTGCKRCRATAKKNDEQKAKELEAKATETSSSELIVALSALPRAEEAPVPPPQSLNELMNHTLKDYHEECVDEGTWQPDPATDVGEWEEYELNEMDAKMNDMLYQACPFHPHHFIYCLNPQTEFASLWYKCPQESCPVYLFEVAKTERRHPSPSAGQIATRFAEVQMRMDPQDDVESHLQD